MEVNNIDNPYRKSTEVDLIDFLAVLIRHRRLILIPTILAVILTAVVLYVLPVFGLNVLGDDFCYSGAVTLNIQRYRGEINGMLGVDLGDVLLDKLNSPDFVGDVYKPFHENGIDEITYHSMIENSVIDNALKFEYDKQTKIIKIKYSDDDKVKAENFVKNLIEGLTAESLKLLKGRFNSLIADTENIEKIAVNRLAAVIASELEEGKDLDVAVRILNSSLSSELKEYISLAEIQIEMQRIIDDSNFPWINTPSISLTKLRQNTIGRTTLAVVIVAIVLFLTILLSFILEYINHIRLDEVSMKKIREAIDRNK